MASVADPVVARIGPNAVLQTLGVLEAREGGATAEAVRRAVGWGGEDPTGLIPEADFLRALEATRATLPLRRAEAVLAESGARTAAYVAANRIPRAARALLRVLPRRLALPLLLRAIAGHAWTFAGSGTFGVEGPYPGTLTLEGAPTCRGPGGSGAYYEAAFAGLLSLAAPGLQVREITCQAKGADKCRFALALP